MIRPDLLRWPGSLRARFCRFALIVATFGVGLVAPSAQGNTPQYFFVSTTVPNGSGNNVPAIVTFTVNTATGALTQITPPPVQTRAQPGPLAINNAGTFLFEAGTNSASQGSVEAFSVGSDGSLTEVEASPFTVSNPLATPVTLAVSPNGAFLYVASSVPVNQTTGAPPSTILDVFTIAANGSLALSNTFAYSAVEICNPPTPALLTPIQLFVHPTQKWLYLFMGSTFGAGCSGQPSEVQPFTINSDGTLSAGTLDILPLYATAGYALTGSPDGSILFLMTQQSPQDGIIYASGIDQSTGGVSFGLAYSYSQDGGTPVLSTGALAVDSTSTYLYSSAGIFSIQDGAITALDSSSNPYTGGASLLASTSLPLIFAQGVGQGQNMILSDLVNSDGSLTPAPGSPYTLFSDGAVLSGAAPVPTKPVMWVQPDGPISITGVTSGQTGTSTLTISNTGFGPLTVTSVTASGDPSLTQTNTCTTAPIAPGTNCQVTVNFAPMSANTFTGTLTIESNTPTRSFAITATSESPAPNPAILPSQQVLLPDAALSSSSSTTIKLINENGATGPLTVSGFSWAGSNPNDFSESDNCTSPITAGNSCSIDITFTPLALGGRTALLNIATNGGVVQATVSGTAVTTVTKFTFSISVTGPGTVTQSPTGTSFPNNTTITLTETPNANASFVNWTGVCTQIFVGPCTFVLNSNVAATANFSGIVSLTTTVVGPGTITQSPTGTSFASGTAVTLTAVPNTGAAFTSWSGGECSGSTTTTCAFNISNNTSVTATFSSPPAVTTPNSSQTGTAGSTFTFPLSASGFATTPTYTASCTIPAGSCTISGTMLVVTTTAQNGAAVRLATAWSGPLSGTGNARHDASYAVGTSSTAAKGFAIILVAGLILGMLAKMAPQSRAKARHALPVIRLRELAPALATLVAFAGLALLAACGGGGGGTPATGTPAGTYTITITAMAGAQTATTNVSITVQ